MAIQSAFETDVTTPIREKQNDWLARQLEGMIQGTLPNMRFMPWGDIQSGPDGGVTHEIAGVADAATWALKHPQGVFFSRWLASKRRMNRFHRDTAILYFLYTRHLKAKPAEPPLAMLTGGTHSGQAMTRSSWKDDATVVGFRCTDYYQGHFHCDVGSFIIYRHGLLAADAGRYTLYYKNVRAPIAATTAHNTLLLGRQGQREVEGQWYKDLVAFTTALADRRNDRRLERGEVPFFKHTGEWTAVAGQFAQAYPPGLVASCVRQVLFVRPGTIAIVDQVKPAADKPAPEVTWMLHVPSEKTAVGKGSVTASNEQSWLRCRDLLSAEIPATEPSLVTQLAADSRNLTPITRVKFISKEQPGALALVHLIEVGDGAPGPAAEVKPAITEDAITLSLDGRTFAFSRRKPFTVSAVEP